MNMIPKNKNGWDDIREYADHIIQCIDKFVFQDAEYAASHHATDAISALREYAEDIIEIASKCEREYDKLLCKTDICFQVFKALLEEFNGNEYEEYEAMYDFMMDYPAMTYEARDMWVAVAADAPAEFEEFISEVNASSHFCNPGL